MEQDLKSLCFQMLRRPAKRGAMDAVVTWMEGKDAKMAQHLQQFLRTGRTRPYGIGIRSMDWVERFGALYIAVRVVPKALAVRFACDCAEPSLRCLAESHPLEPDPRRLVELTRAWADGRTTKKAILNLYESVQVFATRIDKEWHRAYAEGEFNSVPKAELDTSQKPLFAIEVVMCAAHTVGLSSNSAAWLMNVDRVVSGHAERESIDAGKLGEKKAIQWQQKRLAERIEQE